MSVNGSDTVWTPEALDLLETLAGLEENLTYSEIARRMTAQFGIRFTKNSCIGRGRRLGLPPRRLRNGSPDLQPAAPLHSVQAIAPIEPVEARRKPNGRDLTMLQPARRRLSLAVRRGQAALHLLRPADPTRQQLLRRSPPGSLQHTEERAGMNRDLAEEAAVIITKLADRLEVNMEEKAALYARIEALEAALRYCIEALKDMRGTNTVRAVACAALAPEQDK